MIDTNGQFRNRALPPRVSAWSVGEFAAAIVFLAVAGIVGGILVAIAGGALPL